MTLIIISIYRRTKLVNGHSLCGWWRNDPDSLKLTLPSYKSLLLFVHAGAGILQVLRPFSTYICHLRGTEIYGVPFHYDISLLLSSLSLLKPYHLVLTLKCDDWYYKCMRHPLIHVSASTPLSSTVLVFNHSNLEQAFLNYFDALGYMHLEWGATGSATVYFYSILNMNMGMNNIFNPDHTNTTV